MFAYNYQKEKKTITNWIVQILTQWKDNKEKFKQNWFFYTSYNYDYKCNANSSIIALDFGARSLILVVLENLVNLLVTVFCIKVEKVYNSRIG